MLTPKEISELLETAETSAGRKADEKREREQRTRTINAGSGMVKCAACGAWFYDTPGNFCSHP